MDDRARFEAWAETLNMDLVTYQDTVIGQAIYSDCNTDFAWLAWQEAFKHEREALLPDALRYRHVRTLSPRAFTELHLRNVADEGKFDDLVDADIELREEAIRMDA